MEVSLKTIRPDHAVVPKVRSDNLPLLCPAGEFCAPVLWGHGEVALLTLPGSFLPSAFSRQAASSTAV